MVTGEVLETQITNIVDTKVPTGTKHLFLSILRKEIVYFDTHKTGELNTKLTDDVNKIQGGIGDKLGSAAQFLSSFLTGLIMGKNFHFKIKFLFNEEKIWFAF